jgi:negative regulator of flagellin synthesis FlgM
VIQQYQKNETANN